VKKPFIIIETWWGYVLYVAFQVALFTGFVFLLRLKGWL